MKLVAALSTIVALGFVAEMWTGCCNTPQPQTVVLACDRDGGDGGDAIPADEDFSLDRSEEALAGISPCARACRTLAGLGCPESRKPAGGRTCVETCKTISPISNYDPLCVADSKSVEEARKCPALKCPK